MRPDVDEILSGFPREVPVFPLSGIVLFPGALLPLHVFEPRYRQMVEDVLAGDALIGMALLKPCDRSEYESAPPYHETICVGHVVHHQDLGGGRFDIALLGLSAGIARPVKSARPYRVARVELVADLFDTGGAEEPKLQRAFEHAPGTGDTLAEVKARLGRFVDAERIPAALINTCALAAPIFPYDKLSLLEERSLARRLDRLLAFLDRAWQWN